MNIIFKRERLLHVLRTADPARDASAASIARLAPAHFRYGQRLEVVSLDASSAPWLRRYSPPIQGMGSVTSRWGYSPKFGRWLRERRLGYDAVIVHGVWGSHARATWSALYGGTTPYFLVPHNELKGGRIWRGVRHWLRWPCILRDATGVIFFSEAEKELADRAFPLDHVQVYVIPDGDLDGFARAVGDLGIS